MRDKKISVRGNLVRDMIQNVMETSLKEPIQTGEFRKNPVEPAWKCPARYEYEIIEMERFKMEYLRPGSAVTGRVVLQLHGGGYIGPMKNIYRKFAVGYSKLSFGAAVLTIDYRVAPEYPYPAALEDAVEAYWWLIDEKHYRPEQIVVAGDSAGGGLSLALGLYLRDHKMPMPAGFILMSPWTDLTCSGESHITNYDRDPLFGKARESMLYHSSYIGEHDPKDPYISPAFGELTGFPPMLIQVGSFEVLLSDSLAVAELARKARVKHRISVYEGMFHVFQMSLNLFPESREAWEEVGEFLRLTYGIKRERDGIMKITIVAVGKIKEKFFADAIAEYSKRLGRYCRLEIIQVADEKTPDKASRALETQIKEKEGERILAQIKDGTYVIALAIEGAMLDSEELAQKIDSLGVSGVSQIVFVIGGSLGLSSQVLARADFKLSFSKMTFPHQLMRVIALEQIYRGYRIICGEPYHK